MNKIILAELKPEMTGLINQIAKFLGCTVSFDRLIQVTTDDERLHTILRSLATFQLEQGTAQPEAAAAVVTQEAPVVASGKTCRCGKPTLGRGATCGAEECKKAHQREYNQAWRERQKAQDEAAAPANDPTTVDELAETDASPFVWPPVASWRVMTGPNAGVFLAQWELGDRLLDLITIGDQMLHRNKGMHEAKLIAGRLVLVEAASGAATP